MARAAASASAWKRAETGKSELMSTAIVLAQGTSSRRSWSRFAASSNERIAIPVVYYNSRRAQAERDHPRSERRSGSYWLLPSSRPPKGYSRKARLCDGLPSRPQVLAGDRTDFPPSDIRSRHCDPRYSQSPLTLVERGRHQCVPMGGCAVKKSHHRQSRLLCMSAQRPRHRHGNKTKKFPPPHAGYPRASRKIMYRSGLTSWKKEG